LGLTSSHPSSSCKEASNKLGPKPRTAPHAHDGDAYRRIDDDTRHDIDGQADDHGDRASYDGHSCHGGDSADRSADGKVREEDASAGRAGLVRQAVDEVLARPAARPVISAPARNEGVGVGVGVGGLQEGRAEGSEARGLLDCV